MIGKRTLCFFMSLVMLMTCIAPCFATISTKENKIEKIGNESKFEYDYILKGMNGTVLYVDSISNNEYTELMNLLYPNGIIDEQGLDIGGIDDMENVRNEFIKKHTNAFVSFNGEMTSVELIPFYVHINDISNGEYDYLFYAAYVNNDVFAFPSEWGNQPFNYITSSETESYFISTDLGIWKLELDELKANKITSDEYNGKNYNEIKNDYTPNIQDDYLLWIDNVVVSPNNDYIIYRTNRDCEELNTTSIWKLDVKTGKEEKINEPRIDNDIVGFISDEDIVVGSLNDTRLVNIFDLTVNKIELPRLENLCVKAVRNGILVFTNYENGSSVSSVVINEVDLNNAALSAIENFSGYYSGAPIFSNDGSMLAIKTCKNADECPTDVLIVDLENKTYHTLNDKNDLDKDDIIQTIYWNDDNQLLIKCENKSLKKTILFDNGNGINGEKSTMATITFGGAPSTIVYFISPLPTYAGVNSKWNQPRSTGTNPHNGVDLNASVNTNVYAPYNGWIEHITGAGGTDIQFVVDVNNNYTKDSSDYAVRFYHLNSREATGYVSQGDLIGKSGSKGTSAAHLHFGIYDRTNYLWLRNEVNYRHLSSSNWNSGKALDIFSVVQWNGTSASFTAYVLDETGASALSEVRMYYRTTSSGTWTDGGTVSRSGYVYTYDFSSIFPSGTTVYWMFRMTRSGISQRAYGPAKYASPATNPNSVSEPYAYWTNTIG